MNQDEAREQAANYSEKVALDRRFLGTIYIGTMEFNTVNEAIRKAFFDGYSKGREDANTSTNRP